MLMKVKMTAQGFANLRRAAFEKFGDLKRFKEWMRGKHFILEGVAYNTAISKEQEEEGAGKWTSEMVERRW